MSNPDRFPRLLDQLEPDAWRGLKYIAQLAPFVRAVAKKINDVGLAGRDMGTIITSAFEGMLRFAAKSADTFGRVRAALLDSKASVLELGSALIDVTRKITEFEGKAINLLAGVSGPNPRRLEIANLASQRDKMAERAGSIRAEANRIRLRADAGEFSNAMDRFIKSIRAAADENARRSITRPVGRPFIRDLLSGIRRFGGTLQTVGALDVFRSQGMQPDAPAGSLTQLTSGFGAVSRPQQNTAQNTKKMVELLEKLIEVVGPRTAFPA